MSEPRAEATHSTESSVASARASATASLQLPREAENVRELNSVLADLWEHSETLMRQEFALAKVEYEARVIHAISAGQKGAISLGLFHAAYLTTLATLVLVLLQWFPPWLASLIVASAASTGAFVFNYLGKRELAQALKPLERPHPPNRAPVEVHGSAREQNQAHS